MQTMDLNPAATTTKPVTEPVTEPVVEPVTQPVTAPATEVVVEPVTPPATETPEGPQNKNYKEYVKRIEAQNKTLKSQVLDTHITSIGLDPTKGLGIAVREAYSSDEFTVEAVAAFASEKYGHVAETPELPEVTQVRTQQQVVETVTKESTPLTPINEESKLITVLEDKMNAKEGTAQDASNSLSAKVAAYRAQTP